MKKFKNWLILKLYGEPAKPAERSIIEKPLTLQEFNEWAFYHNQNNWKPKSA